MKDEEMKGAYYVTPTYTTPTPLTSFQFSYFSPTFLPLYSPNPRLGTEVRRLPRSVSAAIGRGPARGTGSGGRGSLAARPRPARRLPSDAVFFSEG